MSKENDLNYQLDQGQRFSLTVLSRIYLILSALLLLMLTINIVLLALNATQCYEIAGITVKGGFYIADSLTCPNPDVAPIYSR